MVDSPAVRELEPRLPDLPAPGRKPLAPTPFGTPQAERVSWPSLAASLQAALDDRRLFILLPFAIITGLLISLNVGEQPELWVLAIATALLLLAMPMVLRSLELARIAALVGALWMGFCLLPLHGALFGTAMLARPVFGTYQARVDEVISSNDTGQRLIVSAITPVDNARPVPVRRARIFQRSGTPLAIGDIVRGTIRFDVVPGPVVPGGFDSQFHAYFDGIGAYGNETQPLEVVQHGDGSSPEQLVAAIRNGIASRIDTDLQQPAAGVARAIISGDQSAVTGRARDTMATAGIAHVLSVSGLHLTLVAGSVFWLVRLVLALFGGSAIRLPAKPLAAAAGIVTALLYYAISGGNVAALRSTIMIVLVFGAILAGRRALTMRNVAIAGLLVVLTDPASVFRPSFQLSFAAVVALIGAWELVRRKTDETGSSGLFRKVWAYFAGAAATSLVAGAATMLFSIYHFQQTSPLGVAGNLLTLPLVGFVMMPAAMGAVVLMPLGWEGPFLSVMGWSIDTMLWLAGIVASWSAGFDWSPLLTPTALVFGLAALAWFAFFKDRWRLLGPALLIPAVAFFAVDRPPDLLIADTTQAVALRTERGLELVAGKPDSFAVSVWSETYGKITPAVGDSVRCDSDGCLATAGTGPRISIAKRPAAFYEDCGTVDLILIRDRQPAGCTGSLVINRDDLRRGGVHWLAWSADTHQFAIRTAVPALRRPWRPER